MANYYMDVSHGNIGQGMPHAQYILGQGKYEYKDKEVQYVSNKLPSWAENEADFWNEGDYNENINGRVYTEIKLSLPNDLDLENNIKLLDDFVEQTLGEDYYYTAAIHDKESSYEKGTQNIHAHVMFSTRKLDEIERNRETFFKRANRVTKEKGGCKKERLWMKKEKLFDLRKEWEVLQNKYLENNNIDERVSCETLEKQREKALKQDDKLKADLLDREPININGQILMKRKRTPKEEIELEEFKLKREIKNLKEEVYILELKELEKQKIKGLENLKEEKLNLPFSDILNMKSNIEMYNFEMEKSLNNIENVRTLAIKELYPVLSVAELELHNSINNRVELLKIEELQNRVEIELSKVDNDLLQSKIIQVKKGLEERIKTLEMQRANEIKNYEEHGQQITETDIKGYIMVVVFVKQFMKKLKQFFGAVASFV